MEPTVYQDLLWDFAQQTLDRSLGDTLRVYSGENEMFESRGTGGQAFSVFLPIEKAAIAREDQAQGYGMPVSPGRQIELGRQLWEALPHEAKSSLARGMSDQPIRLKISSKSPAIDDLPWEWLNDGTSDPPFALRPYIRLTRSVPVLLPIPPLSLRPPLRVLLVITNPKDERLLDPWREIEAIRPALSAEPYELVSLEEPTWEALHQALREEPQPAIVHYVGHAGIDGGEGNLILQDSDGRSHWIAGSDLSKAVPWPVGLLCLSSCFTAPNYQILGLSRLAHMPATYHLPTCVVTRTPVGEASTRRFWEVFYSQLAEQKGNANEAFHLAQQAVGQGVDARSDWGSFSLVIRDQTAQVLRISRTGPRPVKRNEQEIQAQVTAHLANVGANSLLVMGDDAPQRIQEQLEQQAKSASKYSRGLW